MLTYHDAHAKLAALNQEHLLRFWPHLEQAPRRELLAQIEDLDWATVARMQALLPGRDARTAAAPTGHQHEATEVEPASPARATAAETQAALERGEAALRAGQVGVLLVAGGQGTRLGFDGPKGTFALGPLSGASLFEIHARKILALRRHYRAPVPFYIMTSAANDAVTRRFFEAQRYFGLAGDGAQRSEFENPADVNFFTQGMLPALDPDGRIVMETPSRLSMAPDGHGGILAALKHNGLLASMRKRGLATLYYFQVDNPLVAIADPGFVGWHLRCGAQMSLKVCAKRDPEEGLGVVVRQGGRLAMVEYTELTREQKHATQPDGELRFKYGSVAIHIFDLDFLWREAEADLPLHRAHKKVPFCDEHGRTVKPEQSNAFKFEKFIFDALPDAAPALLCEFKREEEFAPVKNASGHDSPGTARAAMMEKFARWLEAAGVAVPRNAAGDLRHRLEIDPCFAGDARELAGRLPAGFVWDRDMLLK